MSTSPIPVTIIAGFLGAGKTTLLNAMLGAELGQRLAVLVNDFGAINIDARLVDASRTGELIDLPNGCICCTLFGSLVDVFQRLLHLPQPPDHILIEASGVSKPHQIAAILEVTDLQPRLQLAGIITLVDVERVRRLAQVVLPIEEQIEAADLILLNKADLVDEATLAGVRDWVRLLAPEARLLATSLGAEGNAAQVSAVVDMLFSPAPSTRSFAGGHAGHDGDFSTWVWTSDQPLLRSVLAAALDALPLTIYRAKGFVSLAEAPGERHVLQMVGPRWRLEPFGGWEYENPRTTLVLVGASDSETNDIVIELANHFIHTGEDPE